MLNDTAQTNEARISAAKAESVARKLVAARPNDGLAWLQLGEAVFYGTNDSETEHLFRRATEVVPDDWRGWTALGYYFSLRAFNNILPLTQTNGEVISKSLGRQTMLDTAKTAMTEATNCLAKAVALGSNSATMWVLHAQSKAYLKTSESLLQPASEGHSVNGDMLAGFTKLDLTDLNAAIRVQPKEPALSFFHVLSVMATEAASHSALRDLGLQSYEALLAALPTSAIDAIAEDLHRLETLGEDSDKKFAANALVVHALLSMMMRHNAAAWADVQRAVALDPSCDSAWELLVLIAISKSMPDDSLIGFCRARLNANNTALNHLLLGKALVRRQKWDDVMAEANAALALDSNNIPARVLRVATLFRATNDDSKCALIDQVNMEIGALVAKMPDNDEKAEYVREFWLNEIINLGISNEPKNLKLAREAAAVFIKEHPDDRVAKEISAALPEQ